MVTLLNELGCTLEARTDFEKAEHLLKITWFPEMPDQEVAADSPEALIWNGVLRSTTYKLAQLDAGAAAHMHMNGQKRLAAVALMKWQMHQRRELNLQMPGQAAIQ